MDKSISPSERLWPLWAGTAVLAVAFLGICVIGLGIGLFDPDGLLAPVKFPLFVSTLAIVLLLAGLTIYEN